MVHILIDASSLINELRRKRPPHGIPRVTLAYLKFYLDRMQILIRLDKRIFILPKDSSKQIAVLLLDWNAKHIYQIIKLVIKGIFRSRNAMPKGTTYLLKTDQGGLKKPSYIKTLKDKKINLLSVVHDLIPVLNPEYCTPNNTHKFALNLDLILQHSKGILTVSQFTQDVLAHYVQSKGVFCPPTRPATLAPGWNADVINTQPLIEGPYFVTISTIGDRKNHVLLLHIWRDMVDRLGDKAPKLVIIGKRSTKCSYTISLLDRCQQLRHSVIETRCDDQELVRYVKHARALLFPTFTEGYGLPLIEALSIKVPVIVSNLPVFHEIAGDIPEYFDPLDGIGWMQCIEHYAQEQSPRRQAQLERMSGFRIPVWDEHFAKVDAFIEDLELS
ncbi:glycosyltransferase family 4 protein [Legionella shakespearei]|uniref:Putative glycosyl transferase n=1 Tax=Legionella shakespearei DSM 23087 TaxID=1122169 RepID=A0A0W0Z4V9_9GAMM|nr:glycosyltransferase family 1 protein [Legionella shakespearei]KTD64185.1 putative glycosyl transferase [Legionella shakespearei DSM 23087]